MRTTKAQRSLISTFCRSVHIHLLSLTFIYFITFMGCNIGVFFVVNFFEFRNYFFCIVVAVLGLVHDVQLAVSQASLIF